MHLSELIADRPVQNVDLDRCFELMWRLLLEAHG